LIQLIESFDLLQHL